MKKIKKAIWWDPYNAEYHYKLGRELIRIRQSNWTILRDYEKKTNHLESIKAHGEAVRLNPFKTEYHLRLGWEYTYVWQEPDYHTKWLPAADMSIERAAYFAGEAMPFFHENIGNYWVMRSKTMTPADPKWAPAWTKACWHYKKAQEIDGNNRMLKEIIKNIWIHYPDRTFALQAILPPFLPQVEKIVKEMK
ncbi:MAG: hypothetical protein ABII26_07055 [Pseudomonadota bacterium]